jgi:predicted nucleic acid-binding protein
MNSFLLDASALSKRYVGEAGTAMVDYLFSHATRERLMCLMLGVAEVASILTRKRNGGVITPHLFSLAMTQMRVELMEAADFVKLPVDNPLISSSIPLIDQHAINSTDALVLRLALDIAAVRRSAGDDLVLVASDQRLLRAAQAQGLLIFNPELETEAALDALLAV